MKTMWLSLVAIFFITYFHRARGAMAPLPPGSPTVLTQLEPSSLHVILVELMVYINVTD